MKIVTLLLPMLLFMTTVFCQFDPVTVPGSQTRKLTSTSLNGQEYLLQVSLPASYVNNSSKKYPVVYLMDSQWDFPLVTALYRQQYYDGFIPEVIIVGITWGGAHPNPDSLRARDYTPTTEKRLPQSGGAAAFLSFIQTEVFPFVETNYRVDTTDKTLMGCSLGGLFAMYTLFTHPHMFNRYIAASPAFMWDNNVLYQYEKKYFENKANRPAKLFMCVGGVETSVPDFKKLTTFLNNRHYSNVQIESRVLENTGHSGTKGEGYARGLQFVFKRPSIQLSSNILQQYNGSYKLNDGMLVTITTENGALTAATGNTKLTLLAASDTDFYVKSSFLKLHFTKDEKGNVKGFQLDTYGSSEFANKIK